MPYYGNFIIFAQIKCNSAKMPVILKNYINGELISGKRSRYLSVVNPAVNETFAEVVDSDKEDIDIAVNSAKEAFSSWGSSSLETRSRWLMKIADGIENRFEEFCVSESINTGKPLWLCRTVDIPRSIANFRFFASAITQFSSEAHDMPGVAINYTLRQPLGPVACISPWNLPLYLLSWKIAPALAAGNTVVAKPSEVTPYTAYLLSEVCREIDFPRGVLNIVHGLGYKIGDHLTGHKDIKAVSFTGSTAVGRHIAGIAAPDFKKISLEMGGKNPTLIFADCNFDEMLPAVVKSAFTNQGQICLCGSRILIEKPIYEKFKKEFVKAVKSLKVGDPIDPNTMVGAVVSEVHYHKILSYLQLISEEGGSFLCGGGAAFLGGQFDKGFFVSPTVVEGLDMQCRSNQEEIFGPVASIMPFETEEEAITLANATKYGLSASIWTNDSSRIQRISRAVEAGIVWVNTWMLRDLRTPFGGVKESGVGREGGWEALKFFTEAKNVCIKY